jgi:glutathione S-transferase
MAKEVVGERGSKDYMDRSAYGWQQSKQGASGGDRKASSEDEASEYQRRAEEAEQHIRVLQSAIAQLEFKERSQASPPPSKKIVIGYWKIRGLAQPIRFLLTYLGLPWEDKHYEQGDDFNREQWLKEKLHLGLDFPNLPYLIDGDYKITQSNAILSYLAQKYRPDLAGRTAEDTGRVSMLLNELIDFRSAFVDLSYDTKENFKANAPDFIDTQVKPLLKSFSAYLGDKPYLVGQISLADFIFYEMLWQLRVFAPSTVAAHANLGAYITRFEAQPQIAGFLKSPVYLERPINNKTASFR